MLVDLGLINFANKTDKKFLFTLQRSMNKLFETTKKAAAIPDEPDALIQVHEWAFYQTLINNYLKLIKERSLQLLPFRAHKDNLSG